ncbi:MAG: lanthionine synthetase LanC family protein [Bacteroidales bacterium]|nr:lanthionine synthetase LanC family protein [Bacteroidales bacterium]
MEKLLERIANYVVINAINDNIGIGLLNGKTGIAVFLYHYSRFSGKKSYENVADILIDNVIKNITPNLNFDIFNGISGINIGLKYLIKNHFLEYDNDLEDEWNLVRTRMTNNVTDLNFGDKINLSLSDFFMLSKLSSEDIIKGKDIICNYIIKYRFFFTKENYGIPLPIINSMLHFFYILEKEGVISIEIEQLLLNIFEYVKRRLENFKFDNNGDKLILTELLLKLNYIKGKDFLNEKLVNYYRQLIWEDFLNNYLWQNILYDLPKNNDFQYIENIALAIEDNIVPIPLYKGISSIGLYLMKQ